MRWLLFLLLIPGLAYGQTNDRRRVESQAFNKQQSIKNKSKNTWWRSGNLGLTPELSLLGLGYDSNVLSQEEDEQDDTMAKPQVALDSWYSSSGNWAWQNRGTYSYNFFTDLDRLREPEYSLTSIVHGMFRKTYLEGGLRYFYDQGRQTSEQLERVPGTQRTFYVDGVFQLTARGHLLTDIDFFSVRYDEPEGITSYRRLERDVQRFTAKYLHKVNPRFWPFVGAGERGFDFEEPGNPREDARFTSILVGARNEKGERFHYDVELGSQDMTFDNAPQVEDTFVTTRALLEYKVSRVSSMAVGVLRNPLFSLSSDYAYFLSNRLFLDLVYSFDRNTRLTSGVSFGENSYDNPLNPVEFNRQDDYLRLDLDVNFPLGKAFNITVRTAYEDRSSNLPGASHDGVSVLSDIRYKFQ
ncbi:MAG: outer membrane beta-barrel protein [Acidobacteriota bacterium]|nr:outer membrane beta-barrel protein [Acidobacteriota bacterium]